MKVCRKCSAMKSLSEFHKNSKLADGHVNTCKVCACARAAEWALANPERHALNGARYRVANREHLASTAQKWVVENRERSRQIKCEWKSRNPEAARRHARNRYHRDPLKMAERKSKYLSLNKHVARAYLQRRRAANPLQRITDAMGNSMRAAIRGVKSGKSWRSIVGYDIAELRMRLESLFSEGMTWGNYGDWHIDHIRPVSSFDFTCEPIVTAKVCWALDNLQPLWALDNMKKGARYDHG